MKKPFASVGKYTLCGSLVLALLCSFLVFWYTDIGDTLDNGVLLVEAIANGEFSDYYKYAAENRAPSSVYPANYNILLYAIFAIWNLPTAILHINTGFDYMASVGACLWCKAIILAALFGMFFVVRKITENISDRYGDGNTAGFMALSSVAVMVPALVASQYDCLSLLFMLLGIMFYAEGKNVRFILMFAIAVPLKLFAIFIFIPLLLIRFKNVLKILGMLVSVMIPSFLLELPFKGDVYYDTALGSQNGDAIDIMLNANISIGSNIKVNLFFVAYIIICFACYMVRENNKTKQTRLGVYFSFAVFAAFCTLVPIRSYWLILYTPFLAILAAIKKGNRVVPILADTLAGIGGGLHFLANHWIYNTGTIANQLVFYGRPWPEGTQAKYGHFQGLLEEMGFWDMRYLFYTVFVGALAFALWYLYPERMVINKDDSDNTTDGSFWALLSRPLLILATFAVLMYSAFATMPTVKLGETEYETIMDRDLMKELSMTRPVIFDEDCTVSSLTVYIDAYAYRSARSIIGVRLRDTADKKVLWEDTIGVAVVEHDRAEFDLGQIAVKADNEYELELYAISPELIVDGRACPYADSDGNIAITIR